MSETILNYIKEKRPNISNSSLKTYESILRNLYDKMKGEEFNTKGYNMDNFSKYPTEVLKFLKDLPPNKRKTILSALVVITDNKEYRELMLDDIKEYNKEEAKQTKTDNQKTNWVEKEELNEMIKPLRKTANLLYKKDKLTPSDYQDIQNYIILVLYGGEYIPPRRSKDYVDFKIKNIDKNKDNYMDKNNFVFNSYKTAKTYGKQEVKIPTELKKIINKWIKINPTEYLLFDKSFNKLSNVKLNQRLNKMFGKKSGVNQMRKTFLSSKYGDLIDMKKDLDKTMNEMGSSRNQENIYIKK